MELIRHLDSNRFRRWNEEQQYGQILQSESWGKFKSLGAWNYELIGMENENKELVAACMILKRKLPIFKKYMFYASRGYVLDYTNNEILRVFTEKIKEYAAKENAVMVKIDPCVKYREYDKDGQPVEDGFNHQPIIDYLLELGYKHKGITLDFDGIQPRFVYQLPMNKSLDELLDSFHHKTRYNIRLASKKGVEIYEGNRDDLVEFERIMKVTGSRDGFITRPLSYFEQMYDTLHPVGKLKLYMAKYDVAKALEMSQEALLSEEKKKKPDENRRVKLIKEIEELKPLVLEYPEGVIVSGTIMLMNGKTAWYLYGASDNLYRNVMPNYLIQWKMIQDAYNLGCNLYDFRGISGDLSEDNHLYGLFRFKRGFSGEFVEYIGEFDLIINKFFYMLFEWGVPKAKAIIKKFRR